MANKSLLIKNGSLVSSSGISKSDIFISNGKIVELGLSLDCNADKIIDANGKYIFPGIIDPQVHFRDPGLTHKEDLLHASRACAAGGVTTFLEMPNTIPNAITQELLEEDIALIQESKGRHLKSSHQYIYIYKIRRSKL